MGEIDDPLAIDREFFRALLDMDTALLDRLLAENLVIVDVMSGGETGKTELLEALGAGRLKFDKIETADSRTRVYGDAAIVIGRTEMKLSFDARPIAVKSRYTHVYAKLDDRWKMASAQGTRLVE